MIEPTETENKETIDRAVKIFEQIYETLKNNPETAKEYPKQTVIHRPDEVKAARTPILRWRKEEIYE